MKCSKCKSTDIKTCKVVYQNRDEGLFATNNDLVSRCAPPKTSSGCFAAFLIFIIAWYADYKMLLLIGLLNERKLAYYPLYYMTEWIWWIILFTLTFLIISGWNYIIDKTSEDDYQDWEKSWVCMKCSSIFEIDDE